VLGASLRDKVVPSDLAVRLLEAVSNRVTRVCREASTTTECCA